MVTGILLLWVNLPYNRWSVVAYATSTNLLTVHCVCMNGPIATAAKSHKVFKFYFHFCPVSTPQYHTENTSIEMLNISVMGVFLL